MPKYGGGGTAILVCARCAAGSHAAAPALQVVSSRVSSSAAGGVDRGRAVGGQLRRHACRRVVPALLPLLQALLLMQVVLPAAQPALKLALRHAPAAPAIIKCL